MYIGLYPYCYNALLTCVYLFYCFFFFQAEDGIRDLTVTGVQTCALPISARSAGDASAARDRIARRLPVREDHRQRCDEPRALRRILGRRGRGLRRVPEIAQFSAKTNR